ncbi:MAG: hypothetical protein Q9227_008263 [Pyrenula ochraceoflavens]
MPSTLPSETFQSQPPPLKYALISFPHPRILLVALNRPRSLNCINLTGHWELHDLFNWYDNEPGLRCAVVTGMGKAFSAGADLKEWNSNSDEGRPREMPPSGFGALSTRTGKKPIILALNGLAYGGGCEILINADLAYASSRATLALPEVRRGVVAVAGALPRLIRTVGRARAMEMAVTGRILSAEEALSWGLLNGVVEAGAEDEEVGGLAEVVAKRPVVRKALETAKVIVEECSPDSVIVSREGVKMGWEGVGVQEATRMVAEGWGKKLYEGENIREGLRAFVEKRRPAWRDSKL